MRPLLSPGGAALACSAAALALALPANEAQAQGCLVNRTTTPLLGSTLGPYLHKGEWQVSSSYRTFRADTQYVGTRLSQPISRLGNQVIPKLQTLDIAGTRAITRQTSLTLNLPILIYGSESRALPAGVAGSPRFISSANGIGDLSLTARHWVLDTQTSLDRNVSLGIGVKAPTGNSNAMDRFPNALGQDFRLRPVDPSIQPGDGGWGVIFDVQAFQQVKTATVFFNGTYLMNPRGQTGTLSPRAALNPNGPSAVPEYERYLTVADQYLARVGAAHPVPGVSGLSVMLAGRLEGTPTEDLAGDSVGFRRPGYTIAIEPGLIYARGQTVFSISVPVVTHQNVRSQQPGVPRDSTFADYQIIAGVSHRFGKSSRAVKSSEAPRRRPLIVDARCEKCGHLHGPESAATPVTTEAPDASE
ncbi:MAG: hypothetical protein ACO1SX_27515 [Actinomycetota bacterium]